MKSYFSIAELEGNAQVRFKARLISDMLKDPINLLYFHFLCPIVGEFEKVNMFFQATNLEPYDMMSELKLFYDSFKSRVMTSSGTELPVKDVQFGAKFLFEASLLMEQHKGDNNMRLKIADMKTRCHKMLLEAASQLSQRMPHSSEIFRGLSFFQPSCVLSQVSKVPILKLPMQHLMAENMSEIDNQYCKIILVNWKDEATFSNGIPQGAVDFWSAILMYKNNMGEQSFKDYASYALACLTTRTSNAIVERIFSYVTNIKTKQRNRMSIEMLEAILRIRTNLHFGEECCRDFEVTDKMVSLFK